jgi:hypothetical protein
LEILVFQKLKITILLILLNKLTLKHLAYKQLDYLELQMMDFSKAFALTCSVFVKEASFELEEGNFPFMFVPELSPAHATITTASSSSSAVR